jgi:capsular exopolysaccharide synthesis family protein
MEEDKRRLEEAAKQAASQPGSGAYSASPPRLQAAIAPSGATVPNAEIAPQEFFSRSSHSDVDAIQIKRVVRMIRRRWLTIGLLTLVLPGAMYCYDGLFNRTPFKEIVPASLRATQIYQATSNFERKTAVVTLETTDSFRARTAQNANINQIVSREEFLEKLCDNAQLKTDLKYRDAELKEVQDLISRFRNGEGGLASISASALIDGIASVRVRGTHPKLLVALASGMVETLNWYFLKERRESFRSVLDNHRNMKSEWDGKCNKSSVQLDEVTRAIKKELGDDNQMLEKESFLLLPNLKREEFQLQQAQTDLNIQLVLFKKKAKYDEIAARLKIKDDADIVKVLVNGNPLRMEWAKLEGELTKIKTRYTDEHPSVITLENDIEAIKERLKKTGGATSAGEVPPLPKLNEIEALGRVSQLRDQIELNERRLAVLAEKIKVVEKQREEETPIKRRVSPQLIQRQEEINNELSYLRSKSRFVANKIADIETALAQLSGEDEKNEEFALLGEPGGAGMISPTTYMDVLLALIVGLMFGCGVAFLVESMDNRLHTPTDVYYHLRINYLGVIPYWGAAEQVTISPERPDSHIAEVYAHLCNNIRYGRMGNPEKRLLIASATQGEGKSTISANLAIRYALEGNNVILIDADMRRPRGHKILDIFQGEKTMQFGLSDLLSGDASFKEVVYGTSIPGLSLMPAGSRVRNAAKLLGSPNMETLLKEAEENFDIVIVDCPAVLPVVDATIIAPLMRGVLLVAAAEEAEIGAVRMAMYRLQHVGAPLAGAVLNKVRERSASYTYYGYRYRGGYYYSPYGSRFTDPDESLGDSA